ncbi:ATP-dependent DNA helicase PIF1-like [Ischnura elegans]|uniref:ATP-dependent DNA helicase PIF1-like n=1 Tax=Ischnura elegans TaxID=197161 RepID=UPI001ED89BAA|nr:ATP-dependent DNA helicase PIF1-like [Ischnura elegans]
MARGLLDELDEYGHALEEAATFKTGRALRQLFFAVIMFGAPAAVLWERFKGPLSEDYSGRFEERAAYHHALCDIDHMLRPHGRCLRDMGLPEVEDVTTELGREEVRWNPEDAARAVEEWRPKLTEEQLSVVDAVITAVRNVQMRDRVFFIDGPSGTGKTVVLNHLTARMRAEGAIVLCTASTGIAALNHEGGITAHSMFQLPLETDDPNAPCGITGGSQRADLIRRASLIIWDEAPMSHKNTINILDRSLRDICQVEAAFGGKVVVLAGDFRQIPPIIPDGSKADIIGASLKSSELWPIIIKKKLRSILRSRDDRAYSEFVLAVGEDRVPTVAMGEYQTIPLGSISFTTSLQELIDFVYPADVLSNPALCCNRAILSGTNHNISEINRFVLDMIPGEIVRLCSADSTPPCAGAVDNTLIHSDVLNAISHSGVPDHILELKVGCVAILIRNISFEDRLVNGTKVIVEKISRRFIEARIPNATDTVMIPRIPFKFAVSNSGIEMIRKQFPLKVAYGVTINKSQGQTLEKVGVDLRSDVFSHGQLYVALGRVRSVNDVKVLVTENRVSNDRAHTINIVMKELLDT